MSAHRNRWTLVMAAVTIAALIAGPGATAYSQQNRQLGQQLSQEQSQQQQYEQWQDRQSNQQRGRQSQRSAMSQQRDRQMERRVAQALRQGGFGEEGQILILATQDDVILLGSVPERNQIRQIEQTAQQAAGRRQIDVRLQVSDGRGQMSASQLEQRIQQQVRQGQPQLARQIDVRAQQGEVTLNGEMDNWHEMADVIEAAFAAGAERVTSRLSVSDEQQQQQQERERYQARRERYDRQRQDSERQYDQQQFGGQDFGWQQDRQYGRQYDQRQFDRSQDQYARRGAADRDRWYDLEGDRQYEFEGQEQFGRQRQDRETEWQPAQRYEQRTGRFTQQQQSDQLERRIESELQQVRGAENVTVLASENEIHLFGRVRDEQTKQQIARTVKQAAQTQNVENKLMVSEEGWRQQDDQTVEEDVQDEMWWSPFVDADKLRVRANNGVVTLSGEVDDFGEAAAAIENAYEGGAKSVRNRLQVQGRQQMMAREQQRQFAADRGYYPPYGYTPGRQDRFEQGQRDQWQQDDRSQQDQFGRQQGQFGSQRRQDRYDQQRDRQWQQEDRSQQDQPGRQQGQFGSQRQQDRYDQPRSRQWQQDRGQQQMRSGQRQQMSGSDRWLAQQIQRQLRQQTQGRQNVRVVDPQGIYVIASQGTVALFGSVQNENQKQQIEQAIQSVEGVQNVENNLNVEGQQQGRQQQRFGRQDQQQWQSDQQQRQQREQQRRQAQQQMSSSERQLAQQIEQKLQQQLPQADIFVSVNRSTATLHGSVQQQQDKQQAEKIAKSVQGVQDIQNQIDSGGRQQQQMAQQRRQQFEQQRRQAQQQMSSSDRAIARKIEEQLGEQLEGEAAILVVVNDGQVTLRGSVENQQLQQQAQQIAKNAQGVQSVQNNLEIGLDRDYFPTYGYRPGEGQTQRQRQQQQQQQRQQRERQSQQRQIEDDMHQEAMGISGDDHCIQMLKQKLTDQDLRDMAQNIYVTCNEGTMAFYGYVKSEEAKQQLAKVAKQIEGLEEVENNLTVQESWEKKADSELHSDVESQVWWSPFIDSDEIDVTVRNGIVTLSGRVQDWEAAKAAVKNAYDAGAKRVKSRLQYGRQNQQQQQQTAETDQK